jgi:hypothetical protein
MDYIVGSMPNRPELPPIVWNPDSSNCVNPHLLICGSSGAGKTTVLYDLVNYLNDCNKHIFIFDLKGDMVIHNKDGKQIGNYIEFTAWDSDYGISPFEFDTGVTPDELESIIKSGSELTKEQSFKIRNSGPKVQVARITEIIKKNFLPNMGAGQKNILMYLFGDTYKMKGFEYDNYKTWLNEIPSLEDTLELIERIKSHINGSESFISHGDEKLLSDIKNEVWSDNSIKEATAELFKENMTKEEKKEASAQYQEAANKIAKNVADKCYESLEDKIKTYIKDMIINNEISDSVMTSKEWFSSHNIDVSNYSSKDDIRTMLKMESYIKALVDSGVFHSKRPPVKAGLNIINISGLDVEIQRFIVDIWLGKVFKSCKIRGTYKEIPNRTRGDKCDTFVIIDESKLVAGSGRDKNDPFSYLNRIATEARSFGLGLIVAAQSAEHFPQEFLKNFYTQLILNTNVADFDTVRKSFGIDKTLLEFTQKGWGKALVKTGRVFNRVELTKKH